MSEPTDDDSSKKPDLDVPSAGEALDGENEPELDEWWSWGNFARLFVFPLIIVIVSVSIYGLFQYMVRDRRSIREYITTIQSGTKTQRWRTAYSLAQEVRRHGREKEFTRTNARSIIDLYQSAEDPRIRQYLSHVLAELPLEESVEALKKGLKSNKPGVRVNAILALGKMRDNTEMPSVRQKLDSTAPEIASLLEDDSPEVRRMAAFVLGSLENSSVIDELRTTLNDSQDDVRWNGAIALGQLDSKAGEEVLIDILHQAANEEFNDLDPQVRQNLLVNAIKSLKNLESKEALTLLKKIHENDSNPEVRKKAMEAFETIS
jgi:hypothetical protein